mgnify:FL=1
MIWIAVAAAFYAVYGHYQYVTVNGYRERRYGKLAAVVMVLPIIYWAGTRGDVADTTAYRQGFFSTSSSLSSIPQIIISDNQDKGFGVLNVFIKAVIGNRDVIYFIIIAALCMLCVAYTYQKYSYSFALSIFLFVISTDAYQWLFNGMRQFIPAAILFACMGLILKKKYIPLIIIILLVSTIHLSALLMLPCIFIVQGKPWNKKTMLFLAAVVVIILFVDRFTDVLETFLANTQYDDVTAQFQYDDGTNLLRVLVYSVPPVLALIGRKQIEKMYSPIINLSINMSIISMGIYIVSMFTSGIYIGRLPIYFSLYNYILLPWELDNLFTKRSAILLKIAMVGFYAVFCYYQMAVTWGA